MRVALHMAAVLVLVLSLGLHWALFQTVAWTGMILSYSREAPLRQAVFMTFDGEHPCALCHSIRQGRAEEKQQDREQSKPVSKLDLGLIWRTADLDLSRAGPLAAASVILPTSRSDEPPKPHPRGSGSDSPACA